LIAIDNLTKRFQQVRVLDGVGFTVEASELVVIIGPSGGGKSTLLRCLNGLERFDAGRVQIGDLQISGDAGQSRSGQVEGLGRLRQEVGLVFQAFNLFSHLTLLENVRLAPRVVKRLAKEEADLLARRLLTRVGLSERLGYYPHQLSGGQQQRAAMARALAMSPRVMLYDEPTSALDPHLVGEFIDILRELAAEGMTQIVVTHEMKLAREIADRILVLIDGRLVESGTPDEVFGAPQDPLTREYLRRCH